MLLLNTTTKSADLSACAGGGGLVFSLLFSFFFRVNFEHCFCRLVCVVFVFVFVFVSLSFSFSSSIFVLTSKRKGIRNFDVVVEGEGREAPSLPFLGGHPGEGPGGG